MRAEPFLRSSGILIPAARLCSAAFLFGWSGLAGAQVGEGLLVPPVILQDYDRGRNVGVPDRPRPDYAPLGLKLGSFLLYPQVETGTGFTTNTYLAPSDKKTTAFGFVAPAARLQSSWSRHQLVMRGSAELRNFFGEPRRKERSWTANAAGRLELSDVLRIEGEAEAALRMENQFSGEVTPTVAALSRYRRDYAELSAQYQAGRIRLIATADYADFRFRPVRLLSGELRDQSARDRSNARATGQVEYAFSPSLSVFGQFGYARVNFSRALADGRPNLDSNGIRILGGVNIDIEEKARGTIGIGYTSRNYTGSIYPTVSGLSAEARVELFPTQLTTVTVAARRVIEDTNLGTRAYFDNRANVRVDHELLRNLILNASAEYARQDYIGTPDAANALRVAGGGRYLASRRLNLEASLSYNKRTPNGNNLGESYDEIRTELSATLQI